MSEPIKKLLTLLSFSFFFHLAPLCSLIPEPAQFDDTFVKTNFVSEFEIPEPAQFDDTFVKTNFVSEFESAEDMRKGLLATTAMERVKDLDQQLEDQVMDVSHKQGPPCISERIAPTYP
jgi:hypothetical protein